MTVRSSSLFSGGGAFGGVDPPIPFSGVGAVFQPHWSMPTGGSITTTATRLYFIPVYWPRAGFTYTGLKSRNTSTGDNGLKFRMGVYQASSSTGMPTTLVIDAGEITETGSSADLTLAAAWSAPYKGWGWYAIHTQSTSLLLASKARTLVSSVGNTQPTIADGFFGVSAPANVLANADGGFASLSVDTTYGALASTAVAPTTFTSPAPFVAAYKT
jgi:hypothetical protein